MKPKAAFVGFCASDAELRVSRRDRPYLAVSVAVSGLEDGDGDDKPTTFVRCLRFGPDAGVALVEKLRKGADVYVEGALRLGVWTSRDGVTRPSVTVFCKRLEPLGAFEAPETAPSRPRRTPPAEPPHPADRPLPNETVTSRRTGPEPAGGGATGATNRFDDDDIPF